ncbi:MAG: hypothetical protein RL065_20 [Bacteroidota bacterium]|jgi:drug/metabolite transporter (DMT)-like permease
MLFLILSVVTSTLLNIILKSFAKFEINTFQAIVFNYWVCTFTGSLIENYYTFQNVNAINQPWFLYAIILGVSFIILFNLMGWTAQKLGLAIVSISNKLSLLIPVLIAIVYMNESTTPIKITAILLALLAVIMVTISPSNNSEKAKKDWLVILLPLVLFFGSGLNDTIVIHVQKSFLSSIGDDSKFVIWIFQFAALIGSIILISQLLLGKSKFQFKNLVAGICLGIPNYFSMYYLVKALSNTNMPSSLLLPINNVSIVIVSTVVGIFLFKEKLSKIQFLGIGLACFSIIILFLS